MFLFRRITRKDVTFKLITGNKAFDELAPRGSLEIYIETDALKGGDFLTYILLEEQEFTSHLLGLLRYRIANESEFIEAINNTPIADDIRDNINSILSINQYEIIYLSRIGVSQEYQEMRISQIISNFFEFLIQRKKKDVIIYAKILENLIKVVGSHYRILGKGTDEDWGNYFLVSKIIEYNPKVKI
ncbi:MAG TPA: hypothetical protein VMV49_07530 [Candidatus Deferrimicrobium sp.]|nr:hypothetical protein [Candidatus Deferrimicrobium sp.]